MPTPYAATAELLAQRIAALVQTHPEIMAMESAWDLLKIPEFKHDDLQPSMFQAEWALRRAKELTDRRE